VLYRIWWITSDCGRSFTRWALWTVLVAALFAGLYALVGVDYGDHETFLSPLYFSVVTLTTLGFGDVLPASTAGQMLVMIEVVIGYVALGGLLSIFANKMARRAE
jgi:voltage-gated potassium channel Kch